MECYLFYRKKLLEEIRLDVSDDKNVRIQLLYWFSKPTKYFCLLIIPLFELNRRN